MTCSLFFFWRFDFFHMCQLFCFPALLFFPPAFPSFDLSIFRSFDRRFDIHEDGTVPHGQWAPFPKVFQKNVSREGKEKKIERPKA